MLDAADALTPQLRHCDCVVYQRAVENLNIQRRVHRTNYRREPVFCFFKEEMKKEFCHCLILLEFMVFLNYLHKGGNSD